LVFVDGIVIDVQLKHFGQFPGVVDGSKLLAKCIVEDYTVVKCER
jgi:hypothetical protein